MNTGKSSRKAEKSIGGISTERSLKDQLELWDEYLKVETVLGLTVTYPIVVVCHTLSFLITRPHLVVHTFNTLLLIPCVYFQDVGRLDEIRKARDKARAAFEESEKTRQAAAMGGVVGTDFASEMVIILPYHAITCYLECWTLTSSYQASPNNLYYMNIIIDNACEQVLAKVRGLFDSAYELGERYEQLGGLSLPSADASLRQRTSQRNRTGLEGLEGTRLIEHIILCFLHNQCNLTIVGMGLIMCRCGCVYKTISRIRRPWRNAK